jgi:hypothetical protein
MKKKVVQLSVSDESQTTIDMYFDAIDRFSQLARTNVMLSDQLLALCEKSRSLKAIVNNSPTTEEAGSPLKKMLQQSILQSKKKAKGYRYMDKGLNNFCLNTNILGGRRMYEIFHANFKGVFPSPRTMGERVAKFQKFVPEG